MSTKTEHTVSKGERDISNHDFKDLVRALINPILSDEEDALEWNQDQTILLCRMTFPTRLVRFKSYFIHCPQDLVKFEESSAERILKKFKIRPTTKEERDNFVMGVSPSKKAKNVE